jgi:tetrahydromethanopterin S-methyltransferase subunit B
MSLLDKLTTEPNNTSVAQIVAKVALGFVVGLIIAFLVFTITILFNSVIQQ